MICLIARIGIFSVFFSLSLFLAREEKGETKRSRMVDQRARLMIRNDDEQARINSEEHVARGGLSRGGIEIHGRKNIAVSISFICCRGEKAVLCAG